MNKNIIIATAATAVAGALIYFARRRNKSRGDLQHIPAPPSRHLTNSFAKAKQHATNGHGQKG